MANCPNCGSNHIQLQRETNVNWGRAAAGWALFGVVGGAVGAVTGEDRNVNACLDCGTTWRAADLYKTLEIIKHLTQEILDLSLARDRLYLNDFMVEVAPYLNLQSQEEEKAQNLTKEAEKKELERLSITSENVRFNCGCISLFALALLYGICLSLGNLGILIFVLFTVLTIISVVKISNWLIVTRTTDLTKEIKQLKEDSKRVKVEVDMEFNRILTDFVDKHYL